MPDLSNDVWRWYHNVSECYYHIQSTIKYRKPLLNEKVQKIILEKNQGRQKYIIQLKLFNL